MCGGVTFPIEGESSGLGGKKTGSSLGSVLASCVTLGKSLYRLRTGFPFLSGGGGALVMVSFMSDPISYGTACIFAFPLWGEPPSWPGA